MKAMPRPDEEFQRLVANSRSGEERSIDRVTALVYDELRRVAASQLRLERRDHTLQPTALVHEAYARLAEQSNLAWEDRLHFIHIAAAQIRRVLVDHARARNRHKRGGGLERVTLSDEIAQAPPAVDMLALNEALERLDAHSHQDRAIVELKYFGGLTEPEIASVLGIGERTVRRRWTFARAWLFKELSEGGAS
ncbi:MAG TPA: ECF-type sigma factor [Candidatus Krumholzibacteria bacterium]|nr:ECF-type sigma factor [Candidatus Krumholzibacteria bacterium]